MLITPAGALEIILRAVAPLPVIEVPLMDALGRYLAQEVRADRDQPPTDRSAMDGYAVRAADVRDVPVRLEIVGEVAAGSPEQPMVEPGKCVLIMTGAAVPPGADAVVRVEDTRHEGGQVTVLSGVAAGTNIRRRGEEARAGDVVLPAGAFLGPAQAGLCASVGETRVSVHRCPRVAVLCTGEELIPMEAAVLPHQVRDSNGPALRAALDASGYCADHYGIVPDSSEALLEHLESVASGHDVILVSGGLSVGKYDLVPDAVVRVGGQVRFHGVSMKPGMPQLYASLDGNRHLFGLPGNPLSVLTGFYELILPALRRLSGCPGESCVRHMRLPLAAPFRAAKGNRTEFILARLRWIGGPAVEPIDSHGSADIVAAALADGMFAVAPGAGQYPEGTAVEFTPWNPTL